jgi:hypothetical protein
MMELPEFLESIAKVSYSIKMYVGDTELSSMHSKSQYQMEVSGDPDVLPLGKEPSVFI